MRCARCGNENPETNRFCGMCGASLLPATVAAAATQSAAAQSSPLPPSPAPLRPANAPAPRISAPVSEDSPVISGPSFLGLNQPAPRKRESLSPDSHASPGSSNLDYLLEDEEEHKRGGTGKFVLILLALALAVGLGYLRWKNQGFGWMSSGANKPSPASQTSDPTDTSSLQAPAPSGDSAPATPAPQPTTDAAPSTTSPATNPAPGTAPATTTPAPADASPASGEAPADTAAAPPVPVAKEPAAAAATTPPPTRPKPNKSVDEPTAKPPAAVKPAKPPDPVSEAQKYIYGRGVGQDCDRGLRILKPAAAQANPKAMVEMGALYSAGLCTPRDLPTAYRWFALALRKDPDNQAVQTDLQKLWSEMTQPERQLAIRMSQ